MEINNASTTAKAAIKQVKAPYAIGLSLSGGGYRAAAFHLGTLKKLGQLGVLDKIEVLSTVSGGSITGAAYCLSDRNLEHFIPEMVSKLSSKSVMKYVLTSWIFLRVAIPLLLIFCCIIWGLCCNHGIIAIMALIIMISLFLRYQFTILPIGEAIENAYDDIFYKQAILDDLCDKPELAISATNLQTSRPFTFSKRKMGDSKYANHPININFIPGPFPLAKAVYASSCVPQGFSPVLIQKKYFLDPKKANRVQPLLVDGGIYDNQGIHKLTHPTSSYRAKVAIISDAGDRIPFENASNNTIVILLRTIDVLMDRIKKFQMVRNIYEREMQSGNCLPYISLGWNLEDSVGEFMSMLAAGRIDEEVILAHHIPQSLLTHVSENMVAIQAIIENNIGLSLLRILCPDPHSLAIARSVSTNLTKLKEKQIFALMDYAQVMTELQVRLYSPHILNSSLYTK